MSIQSVFRAEPQVQELTEQMKPTPSGEYEVFMPDLIEGEDQVYTLMLGLPARPAGEFREGQIKLQGLDTSPYDLVVGRTNEPAKLRELESCAEITFRPDKGKEDSAGCSDGQQGSTRGDEEDYGILPSQPRKNPPNVYQAHRGPSECYQTSYLDTKNRPRN